MDRIPIAFETLTPPTFEPLSIEEARSQCRLDGTTDFDSDLTWLIQVAREKVENDSERVLMNQAWRMWVDQPPNAQLHLSRTNPFPAQPWLYGGAAQALEIPIKPVTAVTLIEYVDPTGAWVTWNASNYLVDLVSAPVRITPAFGLIWPIAQVRINALRITFNCGHSTPAAIPARARHAMRLLISHWFENREAVGNVGTEIALGYESLINAIRWH